MTIVPATTRRDPGTAPAGRGYRTSSPVTARPMIKRWISEVPSKIVKFLDLRAV